MAIGERLSFLVDKDVAGRMDRVVLINDGRVIGKTAGPDGVVFVVERT